MEALPLSMLLLAVELASGGLFILAMLDFFGEVTGSFFWFNGLMYLAVAAATLWLHGQFAAFLARTAVGTFLLEWQLPALQAQTALAALYCLGLVVRARGLRVAAAAGGAGAGGVALVSLGAQAVGALSPLILLSLLGAALVGGAVSLGLVLGHWYLVDPRMPVRPIRRLVGLLLAALLLQLAVVAASGYLSHAPASSFVLGFWMRLLVGVLFPLVLAWMTWKACEIRALQSATGLLYIATALVIAGEIISKAILLSARVPL